MLYHPTHMNDLVVRVTDLEKKKKIVLEAKHDQEGNSILWQLLLCLMSIF